MMDEKNTALFAAISAAIHAYLTIEEEQERAGNAKLNSWTLQGFQENMNLRQVWQQRGGSYAGTPVSRRAYPLLNYHHH
jgi:hypothetical protein